MCAENGVWLERASKRKRTGFSLFYTYFHSCANISNLI